MNQKTALIKNAIVALIAAILLILFDQFTKYLAVIKLKNQAPFDIIPGVFQLNYLENQGAAFGLLQGQRMFFVIACLFLLTLLGYCFYKMPLEKHFLPLRIIVVFLVAGAIGNVIDRIWHAYVIDFFYFELINFAIFNVADIYISVSTVLFCILLLFYYKEEDLNRIFPRKERPKK